MEYFKVMYDSRVVNYDCRGFIGLATDRSRYYDSRVVNYDRRGFIGLDTDSSRYYDSKFAIYACNFLKLVCGSLLSQEGSNSSQQQYPFVWWHTLFSEARCRRHNLRQ